jgi:hypothetical protein
MNNKLKVIFRLSLYIILGLSLSCSKSPKCWGEDANKGIINKSFNSDIKCLPKTTQSEFIILDKAAFLQTFDSSCSLSNIDFNTESLLGLLANGGCKVKFIREVTKIESENKYHYKVTVNDCGTCKTSVFSYNWVTVPKLPNGWTVTFETKNK